MALQGLASFFRGVVYGPPAIRDADALAGFMAGEASFIAQKCVVEYCRARAGLNWDKLFKEKAFQEALEISRWDSFAAVLEDVAVLAEARLRRHATRDSGAGVATALAEVAVDALHRFGVPAHRLDQGWADSADSLRARLARVALAEPLPAHEVAKVSGKRVWTMLPVHKDLRVHDRELIANNIRFNMCRCGEEMDRRFAPGLTATLPPPPAAAA